MQQTDSIFDNKSFRQRVIQAHLDVLTERFCNIIDKYNGSIVAYSERCIRQ